MYAGILLLLVLQRDKLSTQVEAIRRAGALPKATANTTWPS
jgi:hypothetical protein